VRVRGGRRLKAELLTVGTGDNVIEQLLQADLAARAGALCETILSPRHSVDRRSCAGW